jgi:hypothetical protein
MSRHKPERFRRRSTITDPEQDDDILVGPWRAQVSDVDDPKKLGRVKVVIPEVTDTAEHAEWAWPECAPTGAGAVDGNAYASLFIPPSGAWVWVEFLDGDRDQLVWKPGWIGDDELPDELKTNYPNRRGWKTPSGHLFLFDDTGDADQAFVQLVHRNGSGLAFNGDGSASLTAATKALTLSGGNSPAADAKPSARQGDGLHAGTVTGTVMVASVPVPVQFIYTPYNGVPQAPSPTLVLSGGQITGGSVNVNIN